MPKTKKPVTAKQTPKKPIIIHSAVKTEKKEKTNYYIVIDYPQDNEIIHHPHYTIRLGASENWSSPNRVEISIDGGEWVQCRYSDGFFWYDWSNYQPMEHKIVACIKDSNGKIAKKTGIRKCTTKQ
ncbi:MAG: hypothetical protein A2252_04840 [Elusimicrobia bacterium RIFOXYA2_FULL_39_19]|nr:MAG: hypothetical protein A2252_04840 [Elusimicrobia bacterium RIFOXYA2_FULL_39_19]